jgi:hypothetical protein
MRAAVNDEDIVAIRARRRVHRPLDILAKPTFPTVMVDLVQPNLLDATGDGAVVIKRIRKASEALLGP